MADISNQLTSLFYVDDDQDDREFFQDAVSRLGQEVLLFHMADDLLKAIVNPPKVPSIVFLDLNMPNKNGFEVLKEMKSLDTTNKLPIVIYSTATDSKTVEQCRKLGASLYVRKPSSLPALQQVLRQVLAIDFSSFKPDTKNFVL